MADALPVLDREVEVRSQRAEVLDQALDRAWVDRLILALEALGARGGDRDRRLARRCLDVVEDPRESFFTSS